MLKQISIIAIFFSFAYNCYSLSDSTIVLSAFYHYGFVIPHHRSISYNIEEPIQAIELNLAFKQNSNNLYNRIYRIPEKGAAYKFSSLGNNQVYGFAHSIFAYLLFPISFEQSKSYAYWRMSFGMAYLTQKWDLESNNTNIAIGSDINAYFDLIAGYRRRIANNFFWDSKIVFNHYSNGNYKKPNLGINTFTISSGITYKINNNANNIHPPIFDFNKKWESIIIASFGFNGYSVNERGPFPAYSFQYSLEKNINIKRKYGFGLDIFYEEYTGYALRELEGRTHLDRIDLFQTGLHSSYGLVYDKLEMNLQLGVYLYSQHSLFPIYGRYALRYNIFKNTVLSIGLKAHAAVADFVEWGIGYKF